MAYHKSRISEGLRIRLANSRSIPLASSSELCTYWFIYKVPWSPSRRQEAELFMGNGSSLPCVWMSSLFSFLWLFLRMELSIAIRTCPIAGTRILLPCSKKELNFKNLSSQLQTCTLFLGATGMKNLLMWWVIMEDISKLVLNSLFQICREWKIRSWRQTMGVDPPNGVRPSLFGHVLYSLHECLGV